MTGTKAIPLESFSRKACYGTVTLLQKKEWQKKKNRVRKMKKGI